MLLRELDEGRELVASVGGRVVRETRHSVQGIPVADWRVRIDGETRVILTLGQLRGWLHFRQVSTER